MGMPEILASLKAAGETTRLRMLGLCAQGELTVSELTRILGQSQPRVSRHLKLLCDAGLLERAREGASVFYGVAQRGDGARIARALLALLPQDDSLFQRDRQRLTAVAEERRESAARYFRENAEKWDAVRSLYVDEAEVERVLLGLVDVPEGAELIDVGTGTGRMLSVLAPRMRHAVGVDLSREMLSVARANLERGGLRNCVVRQADMYNLPFPPASFDIATIHQVLHFADRPADVVAEAARVLKPGGQMLIVDFAPHDLEYLREEHAHRRLGFSDGQVRDWCKGAKLDLRETRRLDGDPLTVCVWQARAAGVVRPAEAAA
jgi:ArsR family transcriptional regulator